MNVVILKGRFIENTALRFVRRKRDGLTIPYCCFTLAVRENHGAIQYIDCSAWGKMAETIVDNSRKGLEVLARGSLRRSKAKQFDRTMHQYIDIDIAAVEFLSSSRCIGNKAGDIERTVADDPKSRSIDSY